MPFRGGSLIATSTAGVFTVTFGDPRSDCGDTRGFRSALSQSKIGIRLKVMPFRGGSFNSNQTLAGVFAIYMMHPRSYQDSSIGFRSALLQSKQGLDYK